MAKLDPNHPTIRIMLIIILFYVICSFILNNFIQKDYDYEECKKKILEAKSEEDLKQPVEDIQKVSKVRFYLLFATCGILFFLYVYYKFKTNRQESMAIFLLMFIGASGKLIEKLGLANCLNVPVIDPKGAPSNVLLFDMFYTNFFAYFLDFLYAFVAVIVVDKGAHILTMFKNKKFEEFVHNNLPIFSDGKFRPQNILRFLIYIGTIVVFWNWGSIIRPKITLLLHRYLGIPVIDKNKLNLEGDKKEDKEGHELVTTIPTIGVLSAAAVEGLIFTGLLFPMRKFFIYNLENSKEYHDNKFSVLAKFLGLVLFIPVCIILLTKYTLSCKDPKSYRIQKLSSIVLSGYVLIPLLLLMIHSVFRIKVLDTVKKYKNISAILIITIPIVVGFIMNITETNCISYVSENPEDEKIIETYMSESNTSKCDDSQTKYKYIVGFITVAMMVFSFGPMIYLNKLQPLTGILYFILACVIIRIIYMFQDNYAPYNILNPMRHKNTDKSSEEIDLDSSVSIEASMIAIMISVISLMLFRRFNAK
jgi:hypothetical protein